MNNKAYTALFLVTLNFCFQSCMLESIFGYLFDFCHW